MDKIKEINDDGVEYLIIGIVQQAVADYITARTKLDEYSDRETAIVRLIREDVWEHNQNHKKREWKRRKGVCFVSSLPYKINTLSDAEKELEFKIKKNRDKIGEIQRFFNSQWYVMLGGFDGPSVLRRAEEKYQSMINDVK